MKPLLNILFVLLIVGCGTVVDGTEEGDVSATATIQKEPTRMPIPSLADSPPIKWEFQTIDIEGITIEYATILPLDYDPSKSYPLFIALPPGGQTKSMVDAGLDSFWKKGALFGFIVVSPAKPALSNYMGEASLALPEFITHINSQHNILGKPHLGGVSNGGISTFRAGLQNPDLYQSLTVIPGYAAANADLSTLTDLKISLYVGENDGGWVTKSQSTYDRLLDLGHPDSYLEIVPDEGHLIMSMTADGVDTIFQRLLED